MDKKNRAAFEGFCKRLGKAAIAGENPAEYLAPEVKVCAFALEKGFALSAATEGLSMGYTVPGGEGMTNEDCGDASGFTEGLNNADGF